MRTRTLLSSTPANISTSIPAKFALSVMAAGFSIERPYSMNGVIYVDKNVYAAYKMYGSGYADMTFFEFLIKLSSHHSSYMDDAFDDLFIDNPFKR